jgi:hypothetical protein
VRPRSLIERKRLLRSIVPAQPSVMLYAGTSSGTAKSSFASRASGTWRGSLRRRRTQPIQRSWAMHKPLACSVLPHSCECRGNRHPENSDRVSKRSRAMGLRTGCS